MVLRCVSPKAAYDSPCYETFSSFIVSGRRICQFFCMLSMKFYDYLQKDQYHPVWGHMENYAVGREKRKQLLLLLCQHEADRLEVWAQPVNLK